MRYGERVFQKRFCYLPMLLIVDGSEVDGKEILD